MSTQEAMVDNGVNVDALLDAREGLTDAADAAQFKWRASSEWINGTHTESIVEGFFGLGEEQKHRSAFTTTRITRTLARKTKAQRRSSFCWLVCPAASWPALLPSLSIAASSFAP